MGPQRAPPATRDQGSIILFNTKPAYATSLALVLALVLTSAGLFAPAGAQLRQVTVAPGFDFNVFADTSSVAEFARGAFSGPTAMAFDARGRLFVGTLGARILILLDNDDDGRLDQVKVFATGVPQPLGLEFRANGDLFITSNRVSGVGRIQRIRDLDGDDVADEITTLVDNLPSEGDHQTDRLKFGPDGLLYFGQGSSTDNGTPKSGRPEERPLNATIMRINVDVANPAVEVIATGLRNPFGMAFHPENGQLFSTDGGSGEICQVGNCEGEDLSPPEEINWIVPGGNYGFPRCEGTPVDTNPGCAGVRPPVTQFNKHLTPTSIAFYTGPQAGESRNQMLVTLFKRLGGQGGDLRRLTLTGDAATGFHLTEILPRIADFGIIDPGDGPVDTAIDPITGDIYVARLDTVTHRDLNEHHHIIYRIHRMGSDAMPFIGPARPSGVRAGTGAATVSVIGRHLRPGVVLLADGVPIATRAGSGPFELVGELPAGLTASERVITIEARNPDGSLSNRQFFSVSRTDPDPPPDESPSLTSLFVYKKKRSRVVDQVDTRDKAKHLKLVVTGADFDSGAQLLVGDAALQLISASPTELVGQLTKAMISAPGQLSVRVRNSTGRISNALTLAVAP